MKSKVFRKYLIIVLLCTSIPMIAVMGLLYQIMSQEILRQTKNSEERLIQECRDKYDFSIQSIRQVSVTLMEQFGNGGDDYFLNKNLDEKWKSLENISILQENEIIHSYYAYYLKEERLIKNGSFYDPAFFYDSDFFNFEEVKNRESCYVWKPQRFITDDSVTHDTVKVVTLVRSFPIGAQEPEGYIAINVNFDRFIDLFFISQYRTYSIFSDQGELMYSSGTNEWEENLDEEKSTLKFCEKSEILEGWTYQVNIEEPVLLEPLEPIRIWTIWIFIVGAGGCLLVSLLTSKIFYRPIEDLMKNIKAEKKKTKMNEFQQIYETFIQHEQEKIKIEEKSKKIEPVYYETMIRQLLLYGKHSSVIDLDENSFLHAANQYLVAAFYDYKMKTTEEMGIWSEIKELIYQREYGLEITTKCLGTSIQKNIAAMVFYWENTDMEEEQVYRFTQSIQEVLEKRKEICVSVGNQ